MCGAAYIMPTFDDWNTLSSPNPDKRYWLYLLPSTTTWRPFDAIMGYFNMVNYKMYPFFNHLLVVLAHVDSTIIVFRLCSMLGLKRTSAFVAASFFIVSPAMLGTVLSVDGLNQSFCQLFGLLSVYYYMQLRGRRRIVVWLLLVLCSTFSKDNGLAWAVVAPVISFGFKKINRQMMLQHIACGMAFAIAYAVIRLALPHPLHTVGDHIAELTSLTSKVSGAAKWIGYTWTGADFLALLHAPSRSLLLFVVTLLLSVPFFLVLLFGNIRQWKDMRTLSLVIALVITASPNLIIAMSLMNVYCSLGVTAVLIGWLFEVSFLKQKTLHTLFILFLLAAVITDVHHWYMAWQTSNVGIELAEKVVEETGKPVNKAYNIVVKDDYPKYSSFCVPADEAYGWGNSVLQVTGYQWPKEMGDTTVNASDATASRLNALSKEKLNEGYDCVWIVGKERVEVRR